MTTIADQQPNARGRSQVHTRAFIASGAVTTVLLAGAIVLFSALAAYVAFNGILGDSSESATDSTVLVGTSGAPEAAAAAISRGPDAVAPEPTAPTPVEPATLPPAPAAASPIAVEPVAPETMIETVAGSTTPGTGSDQHNQQGGPLGGTLEGIQSTTENLGIDVPLEDATSGVTGPLDQAVNNTLNNVGGLLGNPDLGDDVSSGLNDVAKGLLGKGGLTDQQLGR